MENAVANTRLKGYEALGLTYWLLVGKGGVDPHKVAAP